MEAVMKQIKTFTLTLNSDEVKMLKILTQNPYLYLDSPEEEPRDFKSFREQIWEVFKDVR